MKKDLCFLAVCLVVLVLAGMLAASGKAAPPCRGGCCVSGRCVVETLPEPRPIALAGCCPDGARCPDGPCCQPAKVETCARGYSQAPQRQRRVRYFVSRFRLRR